MVLSQVKLPNLDCWGPGESIDTHIVGVWNKKGKVTSAYPRCPQCPGGPESARNVKSWLWGSRGVHWYPYYPVSKENFLREILANFPLLCLLLYKIVRNMHIDIGIDIGKIGPIFFKFSRDFYRGYLAFTEQILSDCLDRFAKNLDFSLQLLSFR